MTTNIPMQGIKSELIKSYGYDPDTRTMAIRFRAKEGEGPLYHYANVTPEHWKALTESASKGSFFLNNFKRATDLFPATKIEPVAETDDAA